MARAREFCLLTLQGAAGRWGCSAHAACQGSSYSERLKGLPRLSIMCHTLGPFRAQQLCNAAKCNCWLWMPCSKGMYSCSVGRLVPLSNMIGWVGLGSCVYYLPEYRLRGGISSFWPLEALRSHDANVHCQACCAGVGMCSALYVGGFWVGRCLCVS